MTKFLGDYVTLQAKVAQLGLAGTWTEHNNGNQKQYKARTGAVLNWYESTGSITFGGAQAEKEKLQASLIPLLEAADGEFIAPTVNGKNNKVFVVYGHDENSRTQLDAMLRRWGLEPLILDQLPSKGQTIIEKLEEYTQNVGFGVVLATPDDEGHRTGHEDEKAFRARQNVVLELGMLLAKLGREKVAILLKDQKQMERPSDIQGLVYIPFKDNLQKDAGPNLAKEMRAQGYNIDIRDL